MTYKNKEGYRDPTAGEAVAAVTKDEQALYQANHELIQLIRHLAELKGFEIVCRITLRHRKSGKIFK